MIDDKKVVAIIPARSGSKGVKDKNIKLLNGVPLIKYTIDFAISSKLIDYVIVSTDSEKYAKIAKDLGATVPFIRPSYLAQDDSKGIDVILHALEWVQNNLENVGFCLTLQPTSPFRIIEDLDEIKNIYKKEGAKSIVSVCEIDHPIEWVFKITENLELRNLLGAEEIIANRQMSEKCYRLNGAYYFASISFLLKNRTYMHNNTKAFIMPKIRSFDIDTELDFQLAEYLLKSNFKIFN